MPAGALLYRVHGDSFGSRGFNPGYGTGGRFHFIRDRGGAIVPSLYAAEDPFAALAESVFHDVPVRASRPRLALGAFLGRDDMVTDGLRGIRLRTHVHGRALSVVRTCRSLELVQLHDLGLRRLRVEAASMTDTNPSAYARTRAWAQALHGAGTADGLVWMSRQFNSKKALTLFGDRVGPDDLETVRGPISLSSPPGLYLVYEVAEAAGVTVFQS